MPRIYWDLKRN